MKKNEIGGFTRGQSWENDINRAKHTQSNRNFFFWETTPLFLAFLDSFDRRKYLTVDRPRFFFSKEPQDGPPLRVFRIKILLQAKSRSAAPFFFSFSEEKNSIHNIHISTWRHAFSLLMYRRIVSYLIVSQCIISYRIISYRIGIVSYRYRIVISYRIISYHIVSYRIVSHRIVSYRIVSYRSVAYRNVSYRIVSYASYRIVCGTFNVIGLRRHAIDYQHRPVDFEYKTIRFPSLGPNAIIWSTNQVLEVVSYLIIPYHI